MYIIKALVERKAYIERLKPYPEQKNNLRPYAALIRKLMKYRSQHFRKQS
jgi:hypothetical protein